ncbi:MAG: 2-hydroxyglutaryl-CoA dehydratase [Chloroflexi bacterium]|nr:2-hydroxyglutaryl-CoA dehydratase [Chloroflexota bacterium]
MTKAVIVDEAGAICVRIEQHTGAEHRRLANKVMEEALEQAGISFDRIAYVVATGYGRINVPFADRQITELTCHARGIVSLFPDARTVLDIGGQDAKGMKIQDGRLIDFVMNDKCAAGTGRFLEVVASTLGIKLEDLGPISLKSTKKVAISSTCTIFAQQELSSHLSNGVAIEDIVAGLHGAIARRAVGMMKRLKIEPDVVFTGGVAKNPGVVRAVEDYIGLKVFVPEDPLISGALGAALLGRDNTLKALARGETIQRAERRLTEATFFK